VTKAPLPYRKHIIRSALNSIYLSLDGFAKGGPVLADEVDRFRYSPCSDGVWNRPEFIAELLRNPRKFVGIAEWPIDWWWLFYCRMRDLTPEMFDEWELMAFDEAVSDGEFGRRYEDKEKRESSDDE
jgi:hypothetical protein